MSRRAARHPRFADGLHESGVRTPGRLPVDREAGVIKGVKVCGWESENGYKYDPNGVDASIYEGVDVNIDHAILKSGRTNPELPDRFGRLTRPEKRADGIYADLEYLKAHPMAELVCEAAERMPGAYGLSQTVTKGDFDVDLQRNCIARVRKVKSVDIVANPATTNGLFEESRSMPAKKITVKALLESQRARFAAPPHTKRLGWLNRLLEMDGMGDAMAAETDGGGGGGGGATDPAEALGDGFEAAILAIFNGDGDASEKAKKISELVKTHAKLTTEEEPEEVDESEDADADGGSEKAEKPQPSKEEKGDGKAKDDKGDKAKDDKAESDRRKEEIGLMESLGVKLSSVQAKAYTALTEAADRKAFIKELTEGAAKGNGAGNGTSDKPRSRLPAGLIESQRTKGDATTPSHKQLASRLLMN